MPQPEQETIVVRDHVEVPGGFKALMRPTHRASTIVFPSAEAFSRRREQFLHGYSYGLSGNPTHYALAGKLAELEGARHCLLAPSGLGAINLINQAFLRAGTHVLITDSAYGPTRTNAQQVLARFGVDVEFFDPRIGPEIRNLIRSETKLIWLESPGSLTMEIQDVPAIVAAARDHGVLVAIDNTWATALRFDAIGHGVDFSVQALTKYVNGHSDVLMGSICTNNSEHFAQLKLTADLLGNNVSPDDCSLVMRGLVTLDVRLDRHESNALAVAKWLQGRPEVREVLYPPLESSSDHDLWRRDFKGSTGLMTLVLKSDSWEQACRFADALRLFQIGASWGGVHSLVGVYRNAGDRNTNAWTSSGPLVRLSVGIEAARDLIQDLEQAFESLNNSSRSPK